MDFFSGMSALARGSIGNSWRTLGAATRWRRFASAVLDLDINPTIGIRCWRRVRRGESR